MLPYTNPPKAVQPVRSAPSFIPYDLQGNDVKKTQLTTAIFAALLLSSPLAGAKQDYPAADFQPVIITQDADLIAKHAQSAATAPASTTTTSSKPDPRYPAAHFEPVVVSQDSDLIAKAKPLPLSASSAQSEPVAAESKAETQSANPLMDNYPIALIALALIGFAIWSSRKSQPSVSSVSAPQSTSPAAEAGTGTETGVARYLKTLGGATKAVETGVARYLKTLPESAKAAAETGVSRYLRNRDVSAP